MASLLNLPDELILEILSYIDCLDHRLRTASLRNISLVNRRLHNLNEPYLYSTFSFFAGVPYLFLRTICQNQDLARCVKVVEWDYDINAQETLNYTPGVLAVKENFRLDGVHDKLSEMSARGNDVTKWIQEEVKIGRLYLGDLRALYILLFFATNVEHMAVAETWRWDDYLYWFMPLDHHHTNALSRLTSATLNGPMRLQNITALLIIPTMRFLELTGVIEMHREMDRTFDWDERPREDILAKSKSNIEHFHLYRSYVDIDDVIVAVRHMKGLKSFLYQHEMDDISNGYIPLNIRALSELIKSQAHSLTSLHILDEEGWSTREDFKGFQDPVIVYKTAQSLPNLVNLEISLNLSSKISHSISEMNLVHTPEWQDIPLSLECLTLDLVVIERYDEDCDFMNFQQSLESLAAQKRRGELPNLRELALKRWHPWYGCVPPNVGYIKALLQDAGIQFSSVPAMIGSCGFNNVDIGWVELQTEPDWVLIEVYRVDVA